MTDSEHAALSDELARALGWKPVKMFGEINVRCGDEWRVFDYRDPTVCLPLIEWLLLKGVNVWNPNGFRTDWEWSEPGGDYGKAESFPEAVARAVIAISRDPRE